MTKQSYYPRVLIAMDIELQVVSPLHVGSGERLELSSYDPAAAQVDSPASTQAKSDDEPYINLIQRDGARKPYLPGTTFKGLLRRIGEMQGKAAACDRLFGLIRNNVAEGEPTGQPGAVTVSGGSMTTAGKCPDAPFVDRFKTANPGVFIAARTRIDAATGTAANRALFHEELVAPETIFKLKLEIDARARIAGAVGTSPRGSAPQSPSAAACEPRCALADAREDVKALAEILAPLTGEEGQQIGKGQADGAGAIRLHKISVTGYRLDTTGLFQPFPLTANGFAELTLDGLKKRAATPPAVPIRLVCTGPFLVLDSSKKRERGQEAQGSTRPHLIAQSWRNTLPMILGYGISGALAARAEWLAQVELKLPPRDGKALWPTTKEGRGDVTALDLLLGMTGFRGMLKLSDVTVHEATPWELTSVKIDRFTAGTIDNALFKTRAFTGGRIEFCLAFDERRAAALKSEAEDLAARIDQAHALLGLLKKSVTSEGLQIGHGGNKGFGWFEPVTGSATP